MNVIRLLTACLLTDLSILGQRMSTSVMFGKCHFDLFSYCLKICCLMSEGSCFIISSLTYLLLVTASEAQATDQSNCAATFIFLQLCLRPRGCTKNHTVFKSY